MVDFLHTPEFRMSFPQLFEPREPKNGGKPKYGLAMLFPPDADLTELKRQAEEVAREKWGAELPKKLKSPFLAADDYTYDGYEKGWLLIRATSIQKPGVVDAQVRPIIDPSEIYPGCWAVATVRAFAYDTDGNRGVSFGLGNVQKRRDDDPIGGRSRPENDFQAIGDAGGDDAPASGDSVFA